MKKLIFPLLCLILFSGCNQIQHEQKVKEQPSSELTFFDAVEALKQRYIQLSNQLQDGTYIKNSSGYYELPAEFKKEWFYFLAGMNSTQLSSTPSLPEKRASALVLPVFSSMEVLHKEIWEYGVPNRNNIIPVAHIGKDISFKSLSSWTPHNVRFPIKLPTTYFFNTHLVGTVKENSITIRVITEKHSPDRNSEMMDMGEKAFEFSAWESFDINPWDDEELSPTNGASDAIYFFISSPDWGVFDYEFKF